MGSDACGATDLGLLKGNEPRPIELPVVDVPPAEGTRFPRQDRMTEPAIRSPARRRRDGDQHVHWQLATEPEKAFPVAGSSHWQASPAAHAGALHALSTPATMQNHEPHAWAIDRTTQQRPGVFASTGGGAASFGGGAVSPAM